MSKRRLEDLDHDGHADPKMPRMEPLHMLPPVPHGYYQNLAPFSNQMPYFPPPMMQPLQVCTAEMKRRIYDEGLNSSVFAALMRKSIMNEMCHLLNVVQTPVQERDPEAFQDPTLQQGFNTYSLITHGFGIINQRTWAEMFRSIGQELQNQVYAAHMTMPPFPAPGGYPQMGL
ncbi:unnamed protein product, partial [Mesorhabditis spiculigera]